MKRQWLPRGQGVRDIRGPKLVGRSISADARAIGASLDLCHVVTQGVVRSTYGSVVML